MSRDWYGSQKTNLCPHCNAKVCECDPSKRHFADAQTLYERWVFQQARALCFENLLRAVLSFHQAPHWDEEQRQEWEQLFGEGLGASTKVLCDKIRADLELWAENNTTLKEGE